MARNKLTITRVKAHSVPGLLSDGDGLYLRTSKTGSKSWAFIYIRNGIRREAGLGSYGAGTGQVGLAEARDRADEFRAVLGRGGDPLAERAAQRAAARVATFGEVADEFLDNIEVGWRNEKHRAQWRMTLGDTYCKRLRKLPVNTISTDEVLAALRPIWTEKAETASRLRGRIEKVLDHAKATGRRTGENPARWKGHLALMLPKQDKLARGHHAALPYTDVPAFVHRLRQSNGVGARSLEFLILTAARSGEVRGATPCEFDLAAGLWTIPAARMKAGREHRVPLTDRAVDIVRGLISESRKHVFAIGNGRTPISDTSLIKAMRAAGGDDITLHGFRSAFRDWAGDATVHPREVAEAALAHLVGDETERAYRRSDALEKRRALMEDWAEYCATPNT